MIKQACVEGARGGNALHGLISSAISTAGNTGIVKYGGRIGDVGRIVGAAIVGGTASQLGGGKFANGAITGAYIMMFNCASKKGKWKDRKRSSLGIPKVQQNGLNNCVPAAAECVSGALGNKIDQDTFRDAVGGDKDKNMVTVRDMWKNTYPDLTNHKVEILYKLNNSNDLGEALSVGTMVVIPLRTNHTVVLESVYYHYENNDMVQMSFRVMDPAYGNFRMLDKNEFPIGFIFISK